MLIYWVKNKIKQAPTSVAEIITLLQNGEITEETLAWHKGCDTWLALKELPAMQHYFNTPAQVPRDQPKEGTEEHQSESTPTEKLPKEMPAELSPLVLPSPFQRFLARMFDCSLYAMLYMYVLYFLNISYQIKLLPSNPLVWIPFLFIEALMLRFWKKTPGKALMGMQLYSIIKEPYIPYNKALRRAFFVFLLGTGMMVMGPPIPLFFLALCFSYYKLKKDHITPWDKQSLTIVAQKKPVSIFRNFFAILLIYFSFNTTIFLSMMGLPALLEEMRTNNPAAIEELKQSIDEVKSNSPDIVEQMCEYIESVRQFSPEAATELEGLLLDKKGNSHENSPSL